MIPLVCHSCFKEYSLKDELAGKRVKCKACGETLTVPEAAKPEPEVPVKRRKKAPARDEDTYQFAEEERFAIPSEDDMLPPIVGRPSRPKSASTKSPPKKRRRSEEEGGSQPWTKPYVFIPALYFIGLFLAVLVPGGAVVFSIVTMAAGGLIAFCGGLALLMVMAREDIVCLILSFFVPCYGLYYVITRWEESRGAFLWNLGGIGLVVFGVLGAAGAAGANAVIQHQGQPGMAAQHAPFQNAPGQNPPGQSAAGTPGQPFAVSAVPLPNFPDLGPARPIEGGRALVHDIDLGSAPGNGATPGSRMQMRLYLPAVQAQPGSLACVLVGPAGTILVTGKHIDDAGYHAETMPYVLAGHAALTFSLDGDLGTDDLQRATDAQYANAYRQFSAACAGLVNARNALEFVTAKVRSVDPNRIYIAGHSSAAVLALLFAENEPRVRGCMAYAPAIEIETRMSAFIQNPAAQRQMPGLSAFVKQASPRSRMANLNCPVLLFHAQDDTNTPFGDTERFYRDLVALGKPATFEKSATGDHYQSMIDAGIPHAVRWLQKQAGAPSATPQVGASPIPAAPQGPGLSTPPPQPQPQPQPQPSTSTPPEVTRPDVAPPDAPSPSADRPRNGPIMFLSVKIVNFRGTGDRLAAARQALQGVKWIKLDTLTIDAATQELRVDTRGKSFRMAEVNTALTAAGFDIGSTGLRHK